MTKPIRGCINPGKGCPDNECEECYADLYPDRLACQVQDSIRSTPHNPP